MNEQKRKFAIWKLHEEKPQKIDNFKTDVFVKVDETPSENVNAIHKCDCKFTLQNIKESGNISEEKKVRHLIEVIRKDHKSKTHHKVQQECVSLIANAVSKEGASEIMKTILEISEQVYEAYLHELCHLKRWEELHKILKSYRGKLSNSSLQMLARNCSIDTLIETVEKEETIVELLEVFMEGGKIAVGDHDILVKDLLKREMFRILRVLFHNDIDPILLSFYPGDTPIHAAVCIGLKFEHENCAIFEDFVKMYNRDKMNYKCLNPCQLDNNGKSLDEIISNEPEISRSRKLKVMEILKANGYQEEKMSTNEKIERLEQQLLDEISKLTPGILPKLNLRPIGDISLEKTNQKNKSEMECQAHETTSSFNEVDLKSFESLPWEIECTSGFKKAINSRHVPVQTRKRAFECIKMLAEGYREPHLCKALRHNGNQDIKLFEIKLDKAVRIIWEKAINFSPRCNDMSAVSDNECDVIYSEVIRIWDLVLNHDKIHACVDNITKSYKNCEVFHLSYSSKQKDGVKGSTELKLPKLFTKRNTNELMVFGETEHNFYISVNPNVAKFYGISPDLVSHALTYLNNDVDIPFKVTDLEYLFIKMKFDAPILLLGRSGTGKTTCCIYKLWTVFEEYWRDRVKKTSSNSNLVASKELSEKQQDDIKLSKENQLLQINPKERLRQLFVTKNPILCSEAERNFIELRKSSSVEKSFSPSERKTPFETLEDIDEKEYPLFLTFKQLIELLDISIGPPFYLANDNLFDWSEKDNNEDLAQLHNNYENFSDFSSEDDEFQSQGPSEKLKSKIKLKSKKHTQRKLLTYDIFERDLWMKIKKGTNCHASLVWTEIRSFIKGSFSALNSPKGHLTLDQYKEIGRKMAPVFQDDRDLIYDMFQSYERVKKNCHYVDEGDVTFNFNHRIRNLRKDVCFHELYVDETQDFTNAELCILIQLCLIPNRIFLTGDTAQCIMQGISFRFKDLRSLFFEIKKNGRDTVNVPEKVYHLPHNYRSHAGILNMATSVLDILKNFFPDSFDDLGNDKGMMLGPKPVILQTSGIEKLHLFLSENERETSKIDLGAHQVVLVAREETKKIVKSTFQKCLVLTIDCAKGLEFDDVLLFNFFKDSHATNEWRVVTSFLEMLTNKHDLRTQKNKKCLTEFHHTDLSTNLSPRPLEFDPRKHKILNTELKRLYTALTRARTNMWIFDEDEKSSSPMFDYFLKRNLVKVKDVESLKTFSKPSAREDWCKQGETYFRKKRYDVAAEYFRNGSDIYKAQLAQAYHEKQQARSVDGKFRKYHLMRAAHLFLRCQKTKKAEVCLISASQYNCLGHFYERTQQMIDAAKMFERAIMPLDQSRCLEALGYFGKSISVLVDSANFDSALKCLNSALSPRKSVDNIPKSLDSFSKIYTKAADYFGKTQKKFKFLEYSAHIECPEERLLMCLKYNFIEEAFRLKIPEGTEDEKVDFYIQCGAVQNALHILKDSEKNKDKQYQCILIMSQIAVQQKERKNVGQIEEKLNTIIQDCSNSVTVSKAHLLIGQLTHKEQHIRYAFELPENERHLGMFIQVECIDLMISKYSLSNDDVLKKITQYLEKFIIFGHGLGMKRFLKPDSWFEQERFCAMCVFYDFHYHRENLYKLYPRQFPLGLKMVEEKQKCQQFEIYFDITTLERHCKKYLKTKFQYWKTKLIDAYIDKRKHFKRSNNIIMMMHFNILSIKAAICLSHLLFCNVNRQCEKFVSDLYCTLFLGTYVISHCENISAFLQNNEYKFIRSCIKENIGENLEKIGSRNERGIAKFIRYFLMANLLDFKDFLAKQLSEYRSSDPDLSISFEKCFDFLVQMEVKKAVCEFDHFCYLLSKENSIPFPSDLFMLFCEMFLAIAFYIIAHSYGKTCWFVVPQTFLDSLRHVENLFLQKNSVLKKISHDNKSEPESVFCLIHLIHILFGFSCKLTLLNNENNKQTEDRVLALGFTILCNLGGILNTADCTDVESNLARKLYQHLKRKKQEKIKQAMSEANFLIDFHKPLNELLESGEHKLLWCRWETEQGLTHATEDSVQHFKGIHIKFDTRVAITNTEIVLDSAENEENHVCHKSSELFNEEYPLPKTDDKKLNSAKSLKRKRRRKLDTINVPEPSGKTASSRKDETTTPRTEYCANDSNELNSPELYIDGTNDQHQTLNDNGETTATNSYGENAAFDNGVDQNKLFESGQPPESLDRSPIKNQKIRNRNVDYVHDAERLPDFDDNVEATTTDCNAGNMVFENISNQKELHDDDQKEENRKINNLFGRQNLTNDNNDNFVDDNLLTDSFSIMTSRDSSIEDLKRKITHEKCSQASTCRFHCTCNLTTSTDAEKINHQMQMNNMGLNDRKFDDVYFQDEKTLNCNPETVLPETNKSMHANDIGDSNQHTQWEHGHDAPLNDIRHLFEIQNVDLMDDQDAPLAFIKYLFEDFTNEDPLVNDETTKPSTILL